MINVHWRELLEATGLLAIVASLIFVGLQIRQEHLIARVEVLAGTAERSAEILEIRTRPEFSRTWAKMLERPKELSAAEIVQIDSFLRIAKESFYRECVLEELGLIPDCRAFAGSHVLYYFGNSHAKNWWKENPGGGPLEWLNEIVLEADTN